MRTHVGSLAIRLFIEEYQPLLTLHGHIHETVDMSGSYMEKIGGTICIASGNHNIAGGLAVIRLDPSKPESARRIIL